MVTPWYFVQKFPQRQNVISFIKSQLGLFSYPQWPACSFSSFHILQQPMRHTKTNLKRYLLESVLISSVASVFLFILPHTSAADETYKNKPKKISSRGDRQFLAELGIVFVCLLLFGRVVGIYTSQFPSKKHLKTNQMAQFLITGL